MAPSDPRQTKFVLDESRIPRAWYNIAADLPVAPVAAPPSRRRISRIGPDDLAPLFPMALIGQEVSAEREIEIPEPVRDAYRAVPAEPALPRPSAREGARYAGPHLLQVRGRQPGRQPQAEHGARPGVLQQGGRRQAARHRDRRRPVGQRAGVRRRPVRPRGQGLHGPRQLRPEAVPPDPHGDLRRRGRGQPVADDELRPHGPGRDARTARARSGIAISEAVEDAATRDDTKYSLGSVLNHVLLHQTVIGQEAIEQMAMAGESPDVVIGCAGGGSNFAGLTFPFLGRNFREGAEPPDHRRRARGRAEPDPRRLRLRLRRHRQDGADRQDAHARPRLRPGADPRRRPALPRHVAAGEPAQGARLHRGPQRPPAGELRGRRPVRPGRGHPAGAGADPRHPRRHRRGARGQARPARRGSSCSTCAATATSTWPPTSATWQGTSRTTSTRRRRSRPRWRSP